MRNKIYMVEEEKDKLYRVFRQTENGKIAVFESLAKPVEISGKVGTGFSEYVMKKVGKLFSLVKCKGRYNDPATGVLIAELEFAMLCTQDFKTGKYRINTMTSNVDLLFVTENPDEIINMNADDLETMGELE